MATISVSVKHTQNAAALTISQRSLLLRLLDETVDFENLIQNLFGSALTFDDLFNRGPMYSGSGGQIEEGMHEWLEFPQSVRCNG